MTSLLPLKKIHETEHVLVFHHPSPSYPIHILLVPKKPIRKLVDLTMADQGILSEVLELVKTLVMEFSLEEAGYRLIVNGGKYQDTDQLHFHLVSG